MSTGFNPYVEWLAVDSRARKPNYYEMLGVARDERDPTRLDSAARTQLAKLNSIDPGSRQELLDELKADLKQAFAVLSCAKQRAQYDQKLDAMAPPSVVNQAEMLPPTKSKKADPPTKTGETKGNSSVARRTDSDLLPPQKVSQADLLPPVAGPRDSAASQPPKANFVARSQPGSSDLDPPMAEAIPEAKLVEQERSNQPKLASRPIPAAVPVSSAETSAVPKEQLAKPFAEAKEGGSGEDAEFGGLQVNDRGGGGSGSKLVLTAVAGLVSLGLVAGAVYMLGLFDLGQAVADKGSIEKEKERTAPVIEKKNEDVLNGGSQNVESRNVESPDVGETDSTDADAESVRDSDSEDLPNEDGGEHDATTPEIEDPDEVVVEPEWQRPEPSELLERIRQIPIGERRRLTNQMILVKNQWLRQSPNGGNLVALETGAAEVGNELRVLNEAIEETSKRLDEFWLQFRKSCAENSGDIEIDERVVGFVEATPQYLILRIAGSNRRYDYRFVPPGVMMAIIDLNAIDDVPTYRLQKAAYLITRLDERPDLIDDVEDLLSASQNDGHDVDDLRLMSQFDCWELSEPDERKEFDSLVNLKKLDAEVLNGFSELQPNSSQDAIRIVESRLRSGQMFDVSKLVEANLDRVEQYMVHLDVLRQLAIQGGDALLVEGVVDLIDAHAANGVEKLRYESLLGSSDQADQDAELANFYCDAVLRLLREQRDSLSPFRARKIGNSAIQLARQHALKAFETQIQALIKNW